MMLSGPPRGQSVIKKLNYLSAGSWTGPPLAPRSMESLAINRRAGREQERERVKKRRERGGAEQRRK